MMVLVEQFRVFVKISKDAQIQHTYRFVGAEKNSSLIEFICYLFTYRHVILALFIVECVKRFWFVLLAKRGNPLMFKITTIVCFNNFVLFVYFMYFVLNKFFFLINMIHMYLKSF